MKPIIYISLICSTLLGCTNLPAQITNPVTQFRQRDSVPNQTYKKWEADINGDGHNEIFLSNKLDFDEQKSEELSPGWFVFLANSNGSFYTESVGVEDADRTAALGEKSVGAVTAQIDPSECFVGQVNEVGKQGIVVRQLDHLKNGTKKAYIFVYTIEGDHLVRTKIAEYDPDAGPNAVYDKYLKEEKRTTIAITDLTPP